MTRRVSPALHEAAASAAARAQGLPAAIDGTGSSGHRRKGGILHHSGAWRTPGDSVPTLWHFTCAHLAPSIIAAGAIVPHRQEGFPRLRPLVWMCDDPDLDHEALGFRVPDGAYCDHKQYRFRVVDPSPCQRWTEVIERAPTTILPRASLAMLHHGRAPHHWWVATIPIPVIRDQTANSPPDQGGRP